MRCIGLIAIVLVAAGCSKSDVAPVRAVDLADAPEGRVGQGVVVDIAERMRRCDGCTAFEVVIPEHWPSRLTLVMPTKTDPMTLVPPFRVRGKLTARGDTGAAHTRRYTIDVTTVSPLPTELAVIAPHIDRIFTESQRWDRKRIVYEGVYTYGFERASLDNRMWVDLSQAIQVGTVRLPEPPRPSRRHARLRVEGVLYVHPGAKYGHLDGYEALLDASKFEQLDVSDAGSD